MQPASIITDHSATIVVDGKQYTVNKDNANFEQFKEAIFNEDWQAAVECANIQTALTNYSDGQFRIENDKAFWGEQEIHNTVVDRIIAFMKEKLPVDPLINFLHKLMENPSKRSVDYLYKFLEKKNLPLTKSGNFLAYKAIRNDWTDKHTGTVKNTVGAIIKMARNQVCDDPDQGCSYGFHIGSINDYVRDFASGYETEGGDRIVIVECSPFSVVSVPHDCNYSKVRTCEYKIIGEYTGPLPDTYVEELNENDDSDDNNDSDTEYDN